jgi:hypothetical protein
VVTLRHGQGGASGDDRGGRLGLAFAGAVGGGDAWRGGGSAAHAVGELDAIGTGRHAPRRHCAWRSRQAIAALGAIFGAIRPMLKRIIDLPDSEFRLYCGWKWRCSGRG